MGPMSRRALRRLRGEQRGQEPLGPGALQFVLHDEDDAEEEGPKRGPGGRHPRGTGKEGVCVNNRFELVRNEAARGGGGGRGQWEGRARDVTGRALRGPGCRGGGGGRGYVGLGCGEESRGRRGCGAGGVAVASGRVRSPVGGASRLRPWGLWARSQGWAWRTLGARRAAAQPRTGLLAGPRAAGVGPGTHAVDAR